MKRKKEKVQNGGKRKKENLSRKEKKKLVEKEP